MPVSRRTVTVLFCDVVDWTPLGAAVDPEVLGERQTRYHTEARAVLERHGATVEKFIGDAVMAVFGWPAAREDDALRAVRAAAELRDRLAELRVRIGVNTGEVAAGDGDALVTGDAVNLAKRLEQAADSGSVLVGTATQALVHGAVQIEPLPPVWLKGVEAPVRAWRLGELLGDARQIARRLDGPFVGRSVELERLRAELEAARGGCRLATVVGAAGLGKSRLAFELGEAVSGEVRVLTGRCLSYGEGITFWPLEEIVREAGGDPAFLAAHADRVFAEARRFLEGLAAERPLLLVLEDIHWAEPTFLDLLEYLTGWSEAPILLLCLARDELFEKRHDWPRGGVLLLEPLSRAEAEQLVSGLGEELDAELRHRIGEIAEGNPLFVEQLAAAAAEGQLSVPPTLQALLAERLDRLAEDERAVIERAAIVGRDFSHESVAALAPPELAARARSLLLGLVRKEVIRPAGGDDGFAFRHALIREAAYDGVPKRTRAELHARVADLSPSDELRGYHLEQAHRYGLELGSADLTVAARAAAALAAAGSRAHERSDMPAALNLLARALALSSPDHPGRPALIHRLALARLESGEGALADEGFELAIREAERSGNRRVEWIARLDAVAHESRGTDLKDVAMRALEVFEELDDHVGLAHAWRRLAVSALRRCSFAEAEHAAELALDYARRAGETHQLGRTIDNLCTAVLYGPAPADEAARRCRELLAETEGDLLVEASVLSSLADLEAMLGRFDEARELAARAHADFEQLGLRRLDAGLSEIEGDIELLAGDPVAAERAFRRGQALLTGGETRMLVTLLAEAVLLQGRLEEAEHLAFEAEELRADDAVAAQVRLLGVRARLLSRRGEHDAALAAARAGVEHASGTDALSMRGDSLAVLAEVAHDDEAATAALRCYEAKRNRAAADRVRRSLLLEA